MISTVFSKTFFTESIRRAKTKFLIESTLDKLIVFIGAAGDFADINFNEILSLKLLNKGIWVKNPSYGLWRHKTELSQIVTLIFPNSVTLEWKNENEETESSNSEIL